MRPQSPTTATVLHSPPVHDSLTAVINNCTFYVLSFPSSAFSSPRILSVNIQLDVEIDETAEIYLYTEILAAVLNNIANWSMVSLVNTTQALY